MKNKNQTGLKNFKPKINLNHNIYVDDTKLLLALPPNQTADTCIFYAK